MRYYYPKTGMVYEDIYDLWVEWETPCKEPRCKECGYNEKVCLLDWVIANQDYAAAIMGAIPYNDICEYLGVLPTHKFYFCGEEYYIDSSGYVYNVTSMRYAGGIEVCNMLKYPEEIEIEI